MKKRALKSLSAVIAFAMVLALFPQLAVTTAANSNNFVFERMNRNITDEQLATMIADGTIPQNVTGLYLQGNQISDLSVLSELKNLGVLALGGNQISDLSPLAELRGLWSLTLDNNQIIDISPLAKLTALQTLWLNDNNISDISAIKKMANLHTLHLHNNQISDISAFRGFRIQGGWWNLNLSGNQISDVSPLNTLTRLRELDLSRNKIVDISPLVGIESRAHPGGGGGTDGLLVLDLAKNQISNILPLKELTGLRSIKVTGNPTTEKQVEELRKTLPHFVSDPNRMSRLLFETATCSACCVCICIDCGSVRCLDCGSQLCLKCDCTVPALLCNVIMPSMFADTTLTRVGSANKLLSDTRQVDNTFVMAYLNEIIQNNADAKVDFGKLDSDQMTIITVPDVWEENVVEPLRIWFLPLASTLLIGEDKDGNALLYRESSSWTNPPWLGDWVRGNWAVRLENNSDAYRVIAALDSTCVVVPSRPTANPKFSGRARIDQDFSGNSLLTGGIGNGLTARGMFGFPIAELSRIGTLDIYSFQLPVDCKQNVLNSISILNQVQGIKYAEPNYFGFREVPPPPRPAPDLAAAGLEEALDILRCITGDHTNCGNRRIEDLDFDGSGWVDIEDAILVLNKFEWGKEIAASGNALTMLIQTEEFAASGTVTPFQPGHVLGKEYICTLDALEILKYIVGIETVIADGNRAFNAARITGGDTPTVSDVLEILKHLVQLPSRLDRVR